MYYLRTPPPGIFAALGCAFYGDGMSTTAPRFSLALPMRFRPLNDLRWRTSITRDVSSSGARFVTSDPLVPGTPVEVEVFLADTLAHSASRILARGEVVRQAPDGDAVGVFETAVHFVEYRLERGAAAG